MFRRMLRTSAIALLAWLLALPALGQDLPNLTALQARGGSVSGLVVDLEDGRVVAELAPDRQVTPASVTKLVTGALALETWGPDHSFTTRIAATATPQDGRVAGDLVLIGGADPALTEEGLWHLARDLAQQGIREVSGDLVVDASRFGHVECSLRDRCEALAQSHHSYAAPLSAAGVNFASVAVTLRPGAAAGQAAQVQPEPFQLPSLQVVADTSTRTGGGFELQVVRDSLSEGERLQVAGSVPAGHQPVAIRRSVAHPERHSGEVLRGFLQREGVTLQGELRFAYTPQPYQLVLAQYEGRPLGETLKSMMYFSTNFTADVLALEMSRNAGQGAPLNLPQAGAFLSRYLHESLSGSRFGQGVNPAASLRDGSGLDPDNRVSARELVALLDRIYMRLDLFQPFLGALSVPLHARGTLLRGQDPEWATNVAGKTGGLSVPVSVTTFAGYLRFPDGGWGAFAFLVNGAPGQPIGRADAFEAMRQDFAVLRSRN